jgi:hypothetical protein
MPPPLPEFLVQMLWLLVKYPYLCALFYYANNIMSYLIKAFKN